MKNRHDVARFIENQLSSFEKLDKHVKPVDHEIRYGNGIDATHYGLCELRDLIDYIYESEPAIYGETIRNSTKINEDVELIKRALREINFINWDNNEN